MANFYKNLDRLVYSAGDLQKYVPIEPARLQMLVKRHFPASEAAKLELSTGRGSRRSYTARMAIWFSVADNLAELGFDLAEAARLSGFLFYGWADPVFADLASNDESRIAQYREMVAVYSPSTAGLSSAFSIARRKDVQLLTTTIIIPLGEFLIALGQRFPDR